MKLTKILDLLECPRGFEPLTLGLEMRGYVVTNCIVLLIYNNYIAACLRK